MPWHRRILFPMRLGDLFEKLTPGVTVIARRRMLRPADIAAREIKRRMMEEGLADQVVLDLKATGPDGLEIGYVEAVEKGRGVGAQVMLIVTDEADKAGVTLYLKAHAMKGGLTQAALHTFYQRRGFSGGERMVRPPRQS